MKCFPLLFVTLLGVPILRAQNTSLCFYTHDAAAAPLIGNTPKSLTSADFNGDGKIDIATANAGSQNVSVVLGLGMGAFQPALNFATGFSPRDIVSADFNNDGIQDIATANASNISILSGLGNGSFGSPVNYGGMTAPAGLAAADFNSDGNVDLAVTNNVSAGYFALYAGTGTGTFNSPVFFNVGANPSRIVTDDFNSDGRMDVAVTNMNSNNVSVCINNGTGGFNTALSYVVGNAPASMVCADFNHDSKKDLAVASYTSNSVSILLGSGAGTFSAATSNIFYGFNNTASGIAAITAYDYNNDGFAELAITFAAANRIATYMNQTNGNFYGYASYVTGNTPAHSICIDLTGDGKADLVTVNAGSNNITVLTGFPDGNFCALGTAKTFTAPVASTCGDFNSDGFQDVIILTSQGHQNFLFGNGTGGFWNRAEQPSSSFQSYLFKTIKSGYYNPDPYLDYVSADPSSYEGGINLGSPGGYFQPGPYGIPADDQAAVDIDNDGYADLVSAYSTTNGVTVRMGGGAPQGGAWTHYPSGGTGPCAIELADLKENGFPDVAVANYSSGNISVMYHNGTGLINGAGFFTGPVNFAVGTNPISIKIGDLNADGHNDIVVSNFGSNNISVLLGTGTGSFAPAVNYSVGQKPKLMALADLNGDQILDIAVPNYGSNNISILIGTGLGTFLSAVYVTVGLHPTSVSAADFNNDGKKDLVVTNGDAANATILLNGVPDITFSTASSVCQGGSVTIQASGAFSYSWSTGANTSSVVVAPTTNTSYSVSATTFWGCMAKAVKSITVNATPTITVSDGTICAFESFTISPAGAVSYTYSSGSAVVNPGTSTSYSVIGTNSLGCPSPTPAISNIIVKPLPIIVLNGNLNVCQSSTTILNITGTDNYTWSNGLSGPNAVYNYSPAANQSVIATDPVSGCINSQTFNLTVIPAPTVSMYGNIVVCNNTPAYLYAFGADTYTWNSGATGTIVTVQPNIYTSYTVVGTDATTGCTNYAVAQLTLSNCTDLNENNNFNPVLIYPNPVDDVLSIEATKGVKFKIINILGQQIMSGEISEPEFRKHIDTSNLMEGTYFLAISSSENLVQVRKFLIRR